MKKFTLIVLALVLNSAIAESASMAKIGTTLQKHLSEHNDADILISLQAGTASVLDNMARQKFGSRAEKLNFLAASLKSHAETTQAPIAGFLKSQAVPFASYWISNQILIKGANAQLIHALGQREDVSSVELDGRIPLLDHVIPTDNTVLAEWGVQDIKAPIVWELGHNGTGARVAIVATGARSTHETLASNYMGNYGWFDPYLGTSTPIDQNGIGTYTTGIVAGSMGIGVAPGATWQSCRGCDAASCQTSALIACGQWIACPTMFDGSAPDCTKAPHAVVSGWGSAGGQEFYDSVIQAWRAADIIPVFGVGASGGASCGTVGSPGDSQAGVLAIGAYSEGNNVTSASGPSIYNQLKPDLVGPGSNIRSAYYTTDISYTTLSSTGNGPAHAIGAIALLKGIQPDLPFSEVYALLVGSADPVNSSGQTCGGIPDTIYPNNLAGYGKINAFRAALALLGK